jgi:sRNA-binding regulator protein Hfq
VVVYKAVEKKIVDSSFIKKADSLAILLDKTNSQLVAYKHQTDSLKTQLFLANYRVEQVKVYIKICNRKPSQIKFLKGWITRAVQ